MPKPISDDTAPKPRLVLSTEGGPGALPHPPEKPGENSKPAFTCSLILPLGRGIHGKTFWARWLIDTLRNEGRTIDVVDADRTNATLTDYFSDAIKPASAEDADVEDRLRITTEAMMERPRTTLMDFGANDLTIKRVALRLGDFNGYLAEGLVRGVAVHFLGADHDDLALLRDMEEGVFAPPATILVLNEALLPPGASTAAFKPIMQDDIFQKAVGRGAVPIYMPRLGADAARELNRRRLGFIAASLGQPGPDGTRIGPWNRGLIKTWREAMFASHAPVMEWLR
jgi:hypothetical protein